ncbi:MAG: sortase [Roseiflexus sp.]
MKGRNILTLWHHPFVMVGLAIALILLGIGAAYIVWLNMLRDQEQINPSNERLLEIGDGQRIPLTQPDLTPIPTAEALPVASTNSEDTPESFATPELLPPERLIIPRIDVDWPITPADVDHLPEFRGIGWIFGSAFPGMPGNMVLTGHVGGPYATLTRLHEVQPGDDVLVQTETATHRYRVQTIYETSPDDVLAMAPSDKMITTLITCSGDWIPERQTNERRLIVVAVYEGMVREGAGG